MEARPAGEAAERAGSREALKRSHKGFVCTRPVTGASLFPPRSSVSVYVQQGQALILWSRGGGQSF